MFKFRYFKSLSVFLIIPLLLLLVGIFSLNAEVKPIKGKPPFPGEDCQTNPRTIWTKQEKWVWEQVCKGEIANFNKVKDYGGLLNPKENNEWPENRVLSPAFIETILLHEPYRGSITRNGVRIVGAQFIKPLELSFATLSHQLWLDSSRFKSEVNFYGLTAFDIISIEGSAFEDTVNLGNTKIGMYLNMRGSKFTGKLNMNNMQADALYMHGGAEFTEVVLIGAKIGDQVSMTGSKFTGALNMNDMQAGHLFMGQRAEFNWVELGGAKIGGQVAMGGSKFTGYLGMIGMQADHLFMGQRAEFTAVELMNAKIGGQVVMAGSKFTNYLLIAYMQADSLDMHGAEFTEVVLIGAKIGGQVSIEDSKFTGKLNMNNMQAGDLDVSRGACFEEPVTLIFSNIENNLSLSGSKISELDLTGTHVGGEFSLGPPATQWSKGSRLILHNTAVSTLQLPNLPNAWPDRLKLTGFAYAFLRGGASEGTGDTADRDVNWFQEWLEKQANYSPQPYEQLAKILRNEGHPDKADQLLYSGKNRELKEVEGIFSLLKLFSLKVLIGYGYRIHYAMFWFLGITTLGVFVLKISGQGTAHGMPYGIAYSLDMLLPIVKLRDAHYDFDIVGWARYYFYLHKLIGYILVSFLIAGLSGLTK